MKTQRRRFNGRGIRGGEAHDRSGNVRRRLSIETLEARCLLAVDLLYLGNQADNSIQVFDAGTGAFVRTLVQSGASSLQGPRGMVIQGNNLLVVNQNVDTQFNGEVLRFNKDTGVALSPLVPSSSSNAPFAPRGIVVKDNVAYVADFFASPSRIAKYNATTGAFIGSLIPNGFTAEFNPRGLVFGPDDKLYVTVYSAFDSDVFSEDAPGYVLRFNDTTSGGFEVIARYTADGIHQTGELHNPEGIVFDPSGTSLYVTSFRPNRSDNGIVVIDVATKSQREFIPLGGDNAAQAILFGPDGRLYVPINAGSASGSVRAYDVATENFGVLIPTANGRLQTPWYLTFGNTHAATLAYNTTAVADQAPVLAGIEAAPQDYQVRAPKKVVSQSIKVTDVDSTVLTGATIRITNNYQSGADVLSLGGPPVVQSSWNPTTGTLTLTGTATLATYQGALRCILYENTSANPTTGQRRIVFQATGGTVTSNQVSRDIRIVAAASSIATVQTFSAPTLAFGQPVPSPPPSQGDAAFTFVTPASSDLTGAEAQSAFLSAQSRPLDSSSDDRVSSDGELDIQPFSAKPLVSTTVWNPSIAPALVDQSLDSLYGDPLDGDSQVLALGDESIESLGDSLLLTR